MYIFLCVCNSHKVSNKSIEKNETRKMYKDYFIGLLVISSIDQTLKLSCEQQYSYKNIILGLIFILQSCIQKKIFWNNLAN